jgi:hypothetical protein
LASPANVMRRSGVTCSTVIAPPGSYYQLGAALPPSDFVEATSEIE